MWREKVTLSWDNEMGRKVDVCLTEKDQKQRMLSKAVTIRASVVITTAGRALGGGNGREEGAPPRSL